MPVVGAVHSITSGNSRSDKTFIGRIEKGFDFLGFHFGPNGLSVAKKTVEKFVARAHRLYEQEPGEVTGQRRSAGSQGAVRDGQYAGCSIERAGP